MSKIKVKCGKFTHKSWVVNGKGKRISDKFELYEKYNYGDFVKLETSNGDYLYHRNKGDLLFNYDRIYLNYITSNLVAIKCFPNDSYSSKIYNLKGDLLLENIDCARQIENGLIPVRIEGKWGFMERT